MPTAANHLHTSVHTDKISQLMNTELCLLSTKDGVSILMDAEKATHKLQHLYQG